MDKTNLSELPKVLKKNGFEFEEVSDEEKKNFSDQINWCYSQIKKSVVNQVVYKMPFEEAVEGIRNRKVFIRFGYAYIAVEDMIPVICAKFRSQLSHSLAVICLSFYFKSNQMI